MQAKRIMKILLVITGMLMIMYGASSGRALYDFKSTDDGRLYPKVAIPTPNTQFDVHNIGRIAMSITNFGTIGAGFVQNSVIDGEQAPSCEYPIKSDIDYLVQ